MDGCSDIDECSTRYSIYCCTVHSEHEGLIKYFLKYFSLFDCKYHRNQGNIIVIPMLNAPIPHQEASRAAVKLDTPEMEYSVNVCRQWTLYFVSQSCIYRAISFARCRIKYNYCPPTKFREGNVFSLVFLCICFTGGTHVTITDDILGLTVQPPPPSPVQGPGPGPSASDIWWPRL